MWNNDKVQFARLLCELVASDMNLTDAAKSMDCEVSDLSELLDRANEVWEDAKQTVAPAPAPTPELVRDDYEMNDRESVWIGIGLASSATALRVILGIQGPGSWKRR